MKFDRCPKIRGFYPVSMLIASAIKFVYFHFPIRTAEHDRFVEGNYIILLK